MRMNSVFRVVKPRNNVLNAWHLNTTNSDMRLNVVLLKKTRKSKLFGKWKIVKRR